MARQAFRLQLTAPLHVGDVGIGQEGTLAHVPSDTLFSALAVTWRELPRHAWRTEQLRDHFGPEPPLLLSSAFPCVGQVPLLPRPHLPLISKSPTDAPERKEGAQPISPKTYKRVAWVSQAVFVRLTSGITQDALNTLWAEAELFQGNRVWLTADEAAALTPDLLRERQIWDVDRVPKVTVDRVRNASALFHVGRVHFADGCGLWCLAQGADDWVDALAAGLTFMADSGLGGQRSKGNGQFALADMTPPDLALAAAHDENEDDGEDGEGYRVLLSRCAPTEAQMERLRAPGAAYQLVTVGGFNGTPGDNPLIRKQVRMLAEGSIIADGEGAPGHLVDVTPDGEGAQTTHRIYRYGFGLGVRAHIPPQEERV